jgi:3',5'-cyclic AMP phosphodiesterase CpdA
MDLTLLHASDLHFGKHFDPQAAESFLAFLQELSPDLLVLSGDFTQRAKVREFEAARAFLDRLPPMPTVVTPGNHDIPLYRVWERILWPRRNYRAHISGDLDTVLRVPGATLVCLDSTSPYTAIVNGRLGDAQLLFAARAFQKAGGGDLKILVTHHNLARAPDYGPEQVLARHRKYLASFSKMGVDLILSGHLHRAYVSFSLDVFPQAEGTRAIPIVQSGTTTSRRGRVRETGKNSLNVIRVTNQEIQVVSHLTSGGNGVFLPFVTYTFPRLGGGVE